MNYGLAIGMILFLIWTSVGPRSGSGTPNKHLKCNFDPAEPRPGPGSTAPGSPLERRSDLLLPREHPGGLRGENLRVGVAAGAAEAHQGELVAQQALVLQGEVHKSAGGGKGSQGCQMSWTRDAANDSRYYILCRYFGSDVYCYKGHVIWD